MRLRNSGRDLVVADVDGNVCLFTEGEILSVTRLSRPIRCIAANYDACMW